VREGPLLRRCACLWWRCPVSAVSASPAASGSGLSGKCPGGSGSCRAACALPGGQGRSRARRSTRCGTRSTAGTFCGVRGSRCTAMACTGPVSVAADASGADPKPGTTEQRPLSIPAVRERIVQAAVKIVLERSSRPTCCRVRSGFARSERRMMPCRFSWTSPGGVAGGWSRRTSPTVSRRFRSRS
jgi:hypothetical protein